MKINIVIADDLEVHRRRLERIIRERPDLNLIASASDGYEAVMLTVHKDDSLIFAAFQTGIVDYIIKTESDEEIAKAIYSAYQDLSPIRPMIARKIRNEFQRMKQSEQSLLMVIKIISDLTPSELAVLQLLGKGYSRKEIAKQRCVEQETVKKQINGLLKKFDKKNCREVIQLLTELNIFSMIRDL